MKYARTATAMALSTLIAACGGGGGSSSSSTTTGTSTSNLTISGVAATGAALTNTTVTAQCASGTGTATQSASTTNGSYSVTITSGTLPCVLTATGTNSANQTVTLHSVTTTTTANITPLTELLVAQLTGKDPSAYVASLNTSTLASTITAANISSAQSAVLTTLTNAGITTTGVTDIVSGSLSAGSGTGYDGVLDTLATALTAAGSTLSTVASTVASTSAGASGSSTVSTASLPADLLLKPQASNCAALRSTNYRAVLSAHHGSSAIAHLSVNATALVVTDLDDNTTDTLTPNGTCRYTTADGSDILVSQAGVIVARGTDSSNNHFLLVAVPEQTHTLAELAGNWNAIGTDTNDAGTSWFAWYGTFSYAANGNRQILAGYTYESGTASAVQGVQDAGTTELNIDGGFTGYAPAGQNYVERDFVYRAGNGELFLINANLSTGDAPNGDGSISFATKQHTISLPAVGSVADALNVSIATGTQLSGSAIASTATTNTILSVDASASSFTRRSGQTGATHSETWTINAPLTGFNTRTAATSVAVSDGSTTTVRETIQLPVPGAGLNVNYVPYLNSSNAAGLNIAVLQ